MTRGWAIHAPWRRKFRYMILMLEDSWAMSTSLLLSLLFSPFCYAYMASVNVFLHQACSSVVVSSFWLCNFAHGYLGSSDSMVIAYHLSFFEVYHSGQFSLYSHGILYLVNPNPGTVCLSCWTVLDLL